MSEVGATDREGVLAAARAWIAGDLDEITRRAQAFVERARSWAPTGA